MGSQPMTRVSYQSLPEILRFFVRPDSSYDYQQEANLHRSNNDGYDGWPYIQGYALN